MSLEVDIVLGKLILGINAKLAAMEEIMKESHPDIYAQYLVKLEDEIKKNPDFEEADKILEKYKAERQKIESQA